MYIEKTNDLLRWRQITCLVVHCIRTDNDITQEEVAKAMHTSRSMIQQLEAGRRRIELAELILLAQAIKTTPEIILKMVMTWGTNVPGLK
jgi:transcriptional regulator with XRE-family HTH domain